MNKNCIFFILPDHTTSFEEIKHPYRYGKVSSIAQSFHPQAVAETLNRRMPINYLGKDAKDFTLVCVPGREHSINNELPWEPQLPIIIKTHKKTALNGYLSGRRSALVLQNGKLYRYKGCGNDGQGFIYQNGQLRGSHFFHTAKRQLYLTQLINQILEEEIYESSANKPLFWFQYPRLDPSFGLKDDLKLFKKFCCVFQTEGDRRIGTHIISPLEILFLNIFDHELVDYDKVFKEKQRKDQWGLTELLVDFEMTVEKGEIFLEKYDRRPEMLNYLNIGEVRKANSFRHVLNFREISRKIAQKFSKNEHERIAELLGRSSNWIDAIETLLQRIGWEMGQIKRIFCKRGINWGFFNDHGYWHCNAHLNNFVAKFPTAHGRLTLPLDFDLAFTKEEFINIDLEASTYGERDDDAFEQLLMSEYNSMEMSVSGVEVMNFRYSIEEINKEPTPLMKMARVVFRDTLVRAFRWGMRDQRQEFYRIFQDWQDHISPIQSLVEACLIISADFQT